MEAREDRGSDPQGRREPARPPEGRDEFNLVEFPLTLLTDRANSFVLGLYRKSRTGSPEAERYLKIILDIYITALLDGRAAMADPTRGDLK